MIDRSGEANEFTATFEASPRRILRKRLGRRNPHCMPKEEVEFAAKQSRQVASLVFS